METGRRKATSRNSVATGSIWESRMIIDEVKGGIKVFNGESNFEEADDHDFTNINSKEKITLPHPKRKTWKSESPEDVIRINRSSTVDDHSKPTFGITATDSSTFVDSEATAAAVGGCAVADGVKKSPIHRKIRSDGCVTSMKVRSEKSTVYTNESGTKSTLSLRKTKSERRKTADVNLKKPKGCLESGVCEKTIICGSSRDVEIGVGKGSETCLNLKEVDVVEAEAEGVTVVEEKMKSVQEKEHTKQVLFADNSAENISMKLMKNIKKTLDSSPPNHGRFHSEDDSNVSHDKAPQPSLCHNNLMNLGELVMWRDSSRSALVFGVGTFFTLLSSYTYELNISFFTVLCYVGILYIAAMYLYKAITSRSDMDVKNWSESYMVSEEEAIRLLKLVLPYINCFIFNMGCLFSGDPITTLKVIACHNG